MILRVHSRASTAAVLLVAAAAVWSPCFAQYDQLAAHLVALSGHTKGIACVPNCGNRALATAIATQSGMLVLALDPSDANVSAARAAANNAGLLCRRVYVLNGSVDSIPLADNYADLLVITDATDADLGSLSRSEILRVLAPFNGKAIIGNTGAGLSQTALQTWANGFGVPGTTVFTDSYGLWARITKPRLAGSDDWAQRFHGPDNNMVSNDSAIVFPYLTQWMGKPYHDLSYGCEVEVAKGRIYSTSKAYSCGSYPLRLNTFYARSAYNGQVLWRRDLPLRYITGFGAMAARGDSLLMMVGDRVAVLDGETGGELGRISFTGLQGHIKKVALLNNVLVVLAGQRDMSNDFPATVTDKILMDSVFYAYAGGRLPYPNGTELAAYDLASNQFLWRYVNSAAIDLNSLALDSSGGGKVILYAKGSRAAALNLRTGAQLWENATPAFVSAAADSTISGILDDMNGLDPQSSMIVSKNRVLICRSSSSQIVSLSTADGSMLWGVANPLRTNGNYNNRPAAQVILNDTLFRRDKLYSLVTGAALSGASPAGNGVWCGVISAGPEMIFSQGGMTYNRSAGRQTPFLANQLKPSCDLGTIPANGLRIGASFKCRCMPLRGYSALGSGGGFAYNQTAIEAQRLTQVPGYQTVAPLTTDSLDWTTYRGNAQHTGSSLAPVSLAPGLVSTFTPDVPYFTDFANPRATTYDADWRLTPPAAVGGYVYIGGYDGKVRCVSTYGGTLAWMYQCGGAVMSTPTVWNGRVYFGSCDGYAYACEATTGRLLWKFRAAPAQRMTMLYGQLASTWPVLCGVLVAGGTAYVAAGGIHWEDGTYVYALDALSGSIKWQNDTLSARQDRWNMGRLASGGMTIAGRRLWLSTSTTATFSLDTATGALVIGPYDNEAYLSTSKLRQPLPGSEIAVFRDRFVMFGGRNFFTDHSERTGTEATDEHLRNATFSFLEITPTVAEAGPQLANHDFEAGDLTGWHVASGTAFSAPTTLGSTGWANPSPLFSQQGRYHLWSCGPNPTASFPTITAMTGVIESDTFTVSGNCRIDYLFAGSNDTANCYLAVVRDVDGAVLHKQTGSSGNQVYQRCLWDASAYRGTRCKIRVVDNSSGIIGVDDIHVHSSGLGEPCYPEVTPPYTDGSGIIPPVWDSDLMVVPLSYQSGIHGWDAATAEAALASLRAANENVNYGWPMPTRASLGAMTTRWGGLTTMKVNAIALAQNAVAMAYTDNNFASWKIGLFSKQTGANIWSSDLPVEPLLYGTCIDRSGSIIVALRDGRVLTYGGAVSVLAPEPSHQATPPSRAGAGTGGGSWTVEPRQPQLPDRPSPEPPSLLEVTWRDVSFRGKPGYTQDEVAPAVPVDTRWQCDKPCLRVAGVSASSFSGVNRPANTTDGDMATRWVGKGAADQWLVYDLGSRQDVSAVTVAWYSRERRALGFTVDLSSDGRTYHQVDQGTLWGRGTSQTLRTFAAQSARYVRATLMGGSGVAPPSVYEVGIHGPSQQADSR